MRNRYLILTCIAAAAAFTSCSSRKTVEKTVRYAKCDTVRFTTEADVTAEFPGRVKAATEAGVAFRVSGQIKKICVKEGDFIRKGGVVAIMDDRDYNTQLTATQAQYDGIKADYDRAVSLYAQNTIPKKDYDKAVSGMKQIEAKLKADSDALSDTRLKAPFDGYVQDILSKEGETVSAGMSIVRMISSSAPEVEINIPTSYFVRSGKIVGATCTFDAIKGKVFNLTLMGVSPKANLNQLYTTYFRLVPDGKDVPAPGMSAMVEVKYATDSTLKAVIPVEALSQKDDRSSVWIYSDGKVRSVPVKVANLTTEGEAIISEGLSEGDVVVTAGLSMLTDGMEVRPLPKESTTNVGGLL